MDDRSPPRHEEEPLMSGALQRPHDAENNDHADDDFEAALAASHEDWLRQQKEADDQLKTTLSRSRKQSEQQELQIGERLDDVATASGSSRRSEHCDQQDKEFKAALAHSSSLNQYENQQREKEELSRALQESMDTWWSDKSNHMDDEELEMEQARAASFLDANQAIMRYYYGSEQRSDIQHGSMTTTAGSASQDRSTSQGGRGRMESGPLLFRQGTLRTRDGSSPGKRGES